MRMLEWILGILLGISIVGNVCQAIFGIRIEVVQSQETVVQNYNVNRNENNNLNIINSSVTLTNAQLKSVSLTNGAQIPYPIIGRYRMEVSNFLSMTNELQTNYVQIGILKR